MSDALNDTTSQNMTPDEMVEALESLGYEVIAPDDEYAPNPHPARLDHSTETIWEWDDERQQYVDTGREPTVMERWIFALEPFSPPFLTMRSKGEATPGLVMTWGWGE